MSFVVSTAGKPEFGVALKEHNPTQLPHVPWINYAPCPFGQVTQAASGGQQQWPHWPALITIANLGLSPQPTPTGQAPVLYNARCLHVPPGSNS